MEVIVPIANDNTSNVGGEGGSRVRKNERDSPPISSSTSSPLYKLGMGHFEFMIRVPKGQLLIDQGGHWPPEDGLSAWDIPKHPLCPSCGINESFSWFIMSVSGEFGIEVEVLDISKSTSSVATSWGLTKR